MIDWADICRQLAQQTVSSIEYRSSRRVGGGCINHCYHLQTDHNSYFLKIGSTEQNPLFESEIDGLRLISASKKIRTPQAIAIGKSGDHCFLALEFISLTGAANEVQAGQQLASMHQHLAQQFGWQRDNFIGLTPQNNSLQSSWVDFWREQRLRPQLQLAASRGHHGQIQTSGEKLADRLEMLIGHAPSPSLLHGDLWDGNIGYDDCNNTVIYDPAVYFGDRETDIAMTELFGGFGSDFYAAYNEAWPLEVGYKTRKKLYNLYHILNHLNLFGGHYLAQAELMIGQLLAETHS